MIGRISEVCRGPVATSLAHRPSGCTSEPARLSSEEDDRTGRGSASRSVDRAAKLGVDRAAADPDREAGTRRHAESEELSACLRQRGEARVDGSSPLLLAVENRRVRLPEPSAQR